jgi:EamA domain-containing membrane protein RarD
MKKELRKLHKELLLGAKDGVLLIGRIAFLGGFLGVVNRIIRGLSYTNLEPFVLTKYTFFYIALLIFCGYGFYGISHKDENDIAYTNKFVLFMVALGIFAFIIFSSSTEQPNKRFSVINKEDVGVSQCEFECEDQDEQCGLWCYK